MKRLAIVLIAVSLFFSVSAFAQQAMTLVNEEEGTISHWSGKSLRMYIQYITYYSKNSAASPDQGVLLSVNDPYYDSTGSWGQGYEDMWGLKRINIENAWKLSTGSGALVAVLDTGIDYTHIDIDGNMWHNMSELNGLSGVDDDGNGYIDDINGWNFYGDSKISMDDHGHGTHVAGIIAAEGNNDEGIIGVAYDATVIPVKIFNSNGGGYTFDCAAGIRYAVSMGAKIINCSFGFPSDITGISDIIDAFRYAYDNGVIIIASAGNDNNLISRYPGLLDYAITVGSIDPSNTKSSFSNYGPQLDVVAPGYDILSLRASGTDMYLSAPGYVPGSYFVPYGDPNAQYYRSWGTSMAAPFVSGVVALMIARDTSLTFSDVSRRLHFSAYDLGLAGRDDYYGWGLIDAFKALSYDWHDNGVIKTWWLADPDFDNVIRYDYDIQSRITQRTLSTGDFIQTQYWGSTTNKQFDTYFTYGAGWQRTIEYYEDGATIHKQWTADAHPGTAGDETYSECDTQGRKVLRKLDDSTWNGISYYGSTTNKYQEYFCDAAWVWQRSIEYYEDGTTIHKQWTADAHPGTAGDETYSECDTQGRKVLRKLDDSTWNGISYYGSTTNKYQEYFCDSAWVWQRSIEYYESNATIHYKWVADANPSTPGDIVYYDYDTYARIIQKTMDTGAFVQTQYWGSTPIKSYDIYVTSGGMWQKTIGYYANGVTMHYQWLADADPVHTGDIVYEEYNTLGSCIFRRFDDGSVWTPQALNEGLLMSGQNLEQNKEVSAILSINTRQRQNYTKGDITISPQMICKRRYKFTSK